MNPKRNRATDDLIFRPGCAGDMTWRKASTSGPRTQRSRASAPARPGIPRRPPPCPDPGNNRPQVPWKKGPTTNSPFKDHVRIRKKPHPKQAKNCSFQGGKPHCQLGPFHCGLALHSRRCIGGNSEGHTARALVPLAICKSSEPWRQKLRQESLSWKNNAKISIDNDIAKGKKNTRQQVFTPMFPYSSSRKIKRGN